MKRIGIKWILGLLVILTVGSLGVWSQAVMLEGKMRVESSVENLRLEPNGSKIGTMSEGTEVDLIAQEGNWVRVRVEGWMWGPSLDGFIEEVGTTQLEQKTSEPVDPLVEILPRLRRLVNEDFGKFYGLNIDKDLRLLRIRLRVGNIGVDRLIARQCKLMYTVWDLVGDNIDVDAIRVESNLPDGNSTVGKVIAETSVRKLSRATDESVEEWITISKFSSNEGKSWAEHLIIDKQ